MKILVLSGSRNRQGQTAKAIDAVCKGVKKGGGTTETIFLTEKNLERCRQCNPDGWGICRSEHRCIIEDDFPAIVKKVKAADVVVFANPVYFGDLAESLNVFLERYRRIRFMLGMPMMPGMPGRPGMPPAGQGAPAIPAIGICYAGGSGNGTVSCSFFLERILQMAGFDVVDMIPLRRQNFDMKLPHLEHVGAWLATKPTSGPPFVPPPPAR